MKEVTHMIHTKNELKEYIEWDARALGRRKLTASLFGDEIWKFQLSMRKLDYYHTCKQNNLLMIPLYAYYRFRYHSLSVKLGLSIPYDICGKGLAIPHYGCIVINQTAQIGENCRILDGVNIGATNGVNKAPHIGNNVFIASGAKIIGDITIADNVAIGANAVVTKSITEAGTTWAGVPAKKISENSSESNLNKSLFV